MALRSVLPLVERVCAEFDKTGVSWCVLRGGHLDDVLPNAADDIDLLVERRHLARADATLRALGCACVPTWGRGAHRFYLAYDPAGNCWLKFDIDAELSYGIYEQLKTRAEAGCLARRERYNDTWILTADDAFWALLLHCLLDKHAFKSTHQRELVMLASKAGDDGELARAVAPACPDSWTPRRLIAASRNAEWDALLAVAPEIGRRWQAGAGLRARRTSVVNGVLQRMTKLLNLTRRRGISVALLGPDGAGKSTLAAGVRESFYFPTRSIYMGLYQRGGGARRIPGIGLVSRLLMLWRNCLLAAYHQSRGRLVIYDRYGYDHRLKMPGRQPFKGRVRRWLLAHACPPPHLTLVLDAPGDVLYARKGEHSPGELEEQRQRFRALAEQVAGVELVDATRDLEEVRRAVIARVWRRYSAGWS